MHSRWVGPLWVWYYDMLARAIKSFSYYCGVWGLEVRRDSVLYSLPPVLSPGSPSFPFSYSFVRFRILVPVLLVLLDFPMSFFLSLAVWGGWVGYTCRWWSLGGGGIR